MSKEDEIMAFLNKEVFEPILSSKMASNAVKSGVRLTITRMRQLDASKMRQYYWSAIIGTERSTVLARRMRVESFTRFEEVIEDFRDRFDDKWLRK